MIAKDAEGVTVTIADAPALCPADPITGVDWPPLVALITTAVLLFTSGAVNNPLLDIVPALADQVTAVFGVPLTRAVNCNCCSEATAAFSGVSKRLLEELDGVAMLFGGVVLQATARTITQSNNASRSHGKENLRPCWRNPVSSKSLALHIQDYLETELGDHRSSP